MNNAEVLISGISRNSYCTSTDVVICFLVLLHCDLYSILLDGRDNEPVLSSAGTVSECITLRNKGREAVHLMFEVRTMLRWGLELHNIPHCV